MDFGVLIRKMTQAACEGDGAGVAACFTEDGVYHDVFYGSFEGRGRIAEMINDYSLFTYQRLALFIDILYFLRLSLQLSDHILVRVDFLF